MIQARRPWRAHILRAAVLVLAAASLTSCSSRPIGTLPKSRSTNRPRLVVGKGGTATVAVDHVPSNLNPGTPAGDDPVTRMVMNEVWPSPFVIAPNLQPVPSPAFLASAELVRLDPQTVVYKINPKATWSDGVPITVADFVYNWRARAGFLTDVGGRPVSSSSEAGYDDITSVTGSAAGETVVVQFLRPFADWESLFADLVPAHVAATAGWNDGFTTYSPSRFVSGGPFMVTAFDPGVSLTLSRNPDYWGPPARLDRIIVDAAGSQALLAARIAHRSVDAAWVASSVALLARFSGLPTVDTQAQPTTTIEELDFNLASPVVRSLPVREAVAVAIDRPALARAMTEPLGGGESPAESHFAVPGELGYEGGNDAAYAKPDPARASRLLASAGYVLGPSGNVVAVGGASPVGGSPVGGSPVGGSPVGGSPLVLRLIIDTADPFAAGVAAAVRLELRGVGVGVVVEPVGPLAFLARLVPGGPWDIALVPVDARAYPSAAVTRFQTRGRGNDTGLDDSHIDALITTAEQELDPIRAQLDWGAVDKALWASMVSLPLFVTTSMAARSSRLVNVIDDEGPPGILWNASSWGLLVPKAPSTVPKPPSTEASRGRS